ncbi:Anaphase-promoting complex subunit 23 [Chytriomyces hyalinus]|nr:Anaphase-promoting complex subunit 23 [Chytriomyces hyalinus]
MASNSATALLHAAVECRQRCLHASSLWLSEMALLAGNSNEHSQDHPDHIETQQHINHTDAVLVHAQALFAINQFSRAAAALSQPVSSNRTSKSIHLDRKKRFLRGYAMLLQHDATGAESKKNDPELLATVLGELERLEKSDWDGFLHFLQALVYKRLKRRDRTYASLVAAVCAYPHLWAAWEELVLHVNSFDQLQKTLQHVTSVPQASMRRNNSRSSIPLSSSTQANQPSINSNSINPTNQTSPSINVTLLLAEASMFYHHQDHPTSVALFEQVYAQSPFLLDKVDEYANALYVLEDGSRLSHLAHRCTQIDAFRPETCIAIANYYSLRREHEKAVTYLKRAVALDAGNSLPWTLIGHEYLEMKNQNAAIEVYRKAVDINDRDFRAWYALGNLYQMLRMPLYALFYFQKATALKCYDSRFWCGLASCYEDLKNYPDAIKCYKRAISADEKLQMSQGVVHGASSASNGGGAMIKIARLYNKMSLAFDVSGAALDGFGGVANGKTSGGGERAVTSAAGTAAAAAACYRAVFSAGSDGQASEVNHADAYEAAEYLVRHAIATHQFAGVRMYLDILDETEDGKALARECRAVMNSKLK